MSKKYKQNLDKFRTPHNLDKFRTNLDKFRTPRFTDEGLLQGLPQGLPGHRRPGRAFLRAVTGRRGIGGASATSARSAPPAGVAWQHPSWPPANAPEGARPASRVCCSASTLGAAGPRNALRHGSRGAHAHCSGTPGASWGCAARGLLSESRATPRRVSPADGGLLPSCHRLPAAVADSESSLTWSKIGEAERCSPAREHCSPRGPDSSRPRGRPPTIGR
jgi:hypothetical protein